MQKSKTTKTVGIDELTQLLQGVCKGYSRKELKDMILCLPNVIVQECIRNGNSVSLPGLGKFHPKSIKPQLRGISGEVGEGWQSISFKPSQVMLKEEKALQLSASPVDYTDSNKGG